MEEIGKEKIKTTKEKTPQQEKKKVPERIRIPLEEYESTAHLSFRGEKLRQLWLKSINEPLWENNLAPLFTSEEVFNMSPLLLGETKEVKKINEDFAFVKSEISSSHSRGIDRPTEDIYGYIMMTEKAKSERGALHFVITQKDEQLPEGKIQGRITLSREKLEEINQKLKLRGRKILPENLISEEENSDTVIDYELIDNMRFFTIVGLQTKDGRKTPLIFNRVGAEGSEGEVMMASYTDGEWGLLRSDRVLVGQKSMEAGRWFPGKGEKRMEPSLAHWGIDPSWGKKINQFEAACDPATDAVKTRISVFEFTPEIGMDKDPESEKKMVGVTEELGYIRLDTDSVVKAIKGELISDKQTIKDSYTLTALAVELIRRGNLVINQEEVKDKYIVLEERFQPQWGRTRLTIPRGPIGHGEKFAEIYPDTGKARITYPVVSGSKEILKSDGEIPKYVQLPVEEIIDSIKNHEFDIVTTSALLKGFLNNDILKTNLT